MSKTQNLCEDEKRLKGWCPVNVETVQQISSALTTVFMLGGGIPYIRAILFKGLKPSRPGFTVWASLDVITCLAMFSKRSLNAQVLSGTFLSVLTCYFAFSRGKKEPWERREKGYLIGGLLGVALWILTQEARHAIIISLAVVFFGALPIFEKAWRHPHHEDLVAWSLFFLSGVPVFLTLPRWTVDYAAQPIVWGLINIVMLSIIISRRRHVSPPPV